MRALCQPSPPTRAQQGAYRRTSPFSKPHAWTRSNLLYSPWSPLRPSIPDHYYELCRVDRRFNEKSIGLICPVSPCHSRGSARVCYKFNPPTFCPDAASAFTTFRGGWSLAIKFYDHFARENTHWALLTKWTRLERNFTNEILINPSIHSFVFDQFQSESLGQNSPSSCVVSLFHSLLIFHHQSFPIIAEDIGPNLVFIKIDLWVHKGIHNSCFYLFPLTTGAQMNANCDAIKKSSTDEDES